MMVCSCGDGSCVLCDDDGMVPIVTGEPYDRDGTQGRACVHCGTAWLATDFLIALAPSQRRLSDDGVDVSPADLIVAAIEAEADAAHSPRADAFQRLLTTINDAHPYDPAAGLREVLRMLSDAADHAASTDQRKPTRTARIERFSQLIKAALFEVRS